MASACIRSMTRISLSSIKSHDFKSASSFIKGSAASASRSRRFASMYRSPVELGCFGGDSLYPLHIAVAEARLTSRLSTASRICRDLSQDGYEDT